MNITRSQIAADVTTSGGTATINAQHPTAEVRALSPAIKKAYAAFEAQNAAATPLRADRKRLAAELKGLRDSKHPAREYDEDRDAELARAIAKLDVALASNERTAKRLAVDYLEAVVNNPRADDAREHAAKLALEAHEAAVAALAALEEALARREVYYASAGRPAEWKHFQHQHRYTLSSGAFQAAHENLAKEVHTFPAGDVKTLAEGGEVLTLAQREVAQQKLAAELTAQAVAEARERNRRQATIEHNGGAN